MMIEMITETGHEIIEMITETGHEIIFSYSCPVSVKIFIIKSYHIKFMSCLVIISINDW